MMKKKFLIPPLAAFLCLSGFSGSLSAAITPNGTDKDSRIQYVEYDTDNVVKIRAKVAHTVTVQLDKGESAEQGVVAMGDAQAWNMAVKGNNLIFKPTAESPQTNLTVITNKRTYVFDLSLAGCSYNKKGKKVCTPPTYLLRFTYPDDIAAAKAAANRQQARAFQMKLKYGLDGAKTPLNYLYYGFGDKKIAPTTIWDDNRFTYLRYADNRDLPMIYKLNPDGTEMLVNTHIEDDTLIIHETAEEFRLRLGKSVLGVRNKGYKVGEFNHLGTNDKNSVRLIKGEE
ncbi:MAG: TrbG/VirB9 family P-type conjugative transfer protein [Neisseriaceae bacterium]|nr:TrbG/VirB9 family P-type conjugative transfer protein [Neisseriaceae bacterium]